MPQKSLFRSPLLSYHEVSPGLCLQSQLLYIVRENHFQLLRRADLPSTSFEGARPLRSSQKLKIGTSYEYGGSKRVMRCGNAILFCMLPVDCLPSSWRVRAREYSTCRALRKLGCITRCYECCMWSLLQLKQKNEKEESRRCRVISVLALNSTLSSGGSEKCKSQVDTHQKSQPCGRK